jgi:N-terminal domain of galactosyltransferase
MKRALHDWPIESRDEPAKQKAQSPALSFIIGHRGKERLPHLLATLQSIAAQRDATFECIVVEQSMSPEIRDQLPGWVRYVHTPLPYSEMPYSRSWAFNVGARAAQAEALVLHDNDMLVPIDYAKEILGRIEDGYEVINLKRFIFYLTETHSVGVLDGTEHLEQRAPEVVVQNLEAGGSVAITREAYFAIGGFDESFVGWGGEDNEFWERASTRRVWPYAYLPIVHLWHAPQTGKVTSDRPTARLYEELSRVPVNDRIADLAAKSKELRAKS